MTQPAGACWFNALVSMHQTIIAAVKTAIEGLTSPPTVVLRDRPVLMEEDSLPLIILTKGKERAIRHYFGGEMRGYVVNVAILYAQNQAIQTGIDDAQDWRETIRDTFVPDNSFTPPILAGVSAVYDCDEVEAPPQRPDIAMANYEESLLALEFRTSE